MQKKRAIVRLSLFCRFFHGFFEVIVSVGVDVKKFPVDKHGRRLEDPRLIGNGNVFIHFI